MHVHVRMNGMGWGWNGPSVRRFKGLLCARLACGNNSSSSSNATAEPPRSRGEICPKDPFPAWEVALLGPSMIMPETTRADGWWALQIGGE